MAYPIIFSWISHVTLSPPIKEITTNDIDNRFRVFRVGDDNYQSIRASISSIRLQNSFLESAIKGKPIRSYARYQSIAKLVNEAINQNSDLLIIPEACVPFEWL